KRQ
ncbi:hypothetical protein D039_0209B, partial [Vibrio parahaemolyticus EKP-028]